MYNQQFKLKAEGQIVDVLRPKLDDSLEASQSQNMPVSLIYKVRWFHDSDKHKGKRKVSFIQSGYAKLKYPNMVINFYDKYAKIDYANVFSTLRNDDLVIKRADQLLEQENQYILKGEIKTFLPQKEQKDKLPIIKEQFDSIKEQSELAKDDSEHTKGQLKAEQKAVNKGEKVRQKSRQEYSKAQKRNLRSGKQTINTIEKQDSPRINTKSKKIKQQNKKVCDFDLINQIKNPKKVIVNLKLAANQSKQLKGFSDKKVVDKNIKKQRVENKPKDNSQEKLNIKSARIVEKTRSRFSDPNSTEKSYNQSPKRGIFDIIKRESQDPLKKQQRDGQRSSSGDSIVRKGNKPSKMRKVEESLSVKNFGNNRVKSSNAKREKTDGDE